MDSQLGLAVRRWCPPVLDLPAHAPIDDYLARRNELGWRTATRRLLRTANLAALLVDTGVGNETLAGLADPADLAALADIADPALAALAGLADPADLAALADIADLADLAAAPVHEVVRLERVAEEIANGVNGIGAAGFADAYLAALSERVTGAVATKSIIAYRYGLAIPADRPSAAQVRKAAGDWLRVGGRLTDPTLLRFVLWAGLDTGLPLQLHTGFGDRDLSLRDADPALLQPFLIAAEPTGVPIVLLHCYPYHRQAGWLALTHPHVYVDVGLTMAHLGLRAGAVLAEFSELVPFGKLLFSTDAYGLPELYLVGAAQFRHALRRLLDDWVRDDAIAAPDAERIAGQICAGNARRIYRL